MPFYEFNQNNSGGTFDFDEDAGITHIVIVEADSEDEAIERAEEIGLYFDGEGDCSCCGDRWSYPWRSDDVPSNFGTPVQDVEWGVAPDYKWIENGPEVYVHFKDGVRQAYGLPHKQLS